VTVTPYDDPTHPVTYADPDGTLTFTNANGTPVPNDPAAVVVNAAPVEQAVPIQSSPVTSTYTQSQYDADMALLAKNAPSLLTPQELAKYGGGSTPAAPAPVVADIFTGGLNTDAPYQIINGQLIYI
jgi:L-aminopeptidase/D-esterase-like protein